MFKLMFLKYIIKNANLITIKEQWTIPLSGKQKAVKSYHKVKIKKLGY